MDGLGSVRRTAKAIRDMLLRIGSEERERTPLWDGPAPGAVGADRSDIPTVSLYAPPEDKRSGETVVVLPGGGYTGHAEHEAAPVGRWLRSAGVVALIVRYRLAPRYKHPVMLQDAFRAMSVARAVAEEWGLRTDRIGILGFSAGGHLAGMTAVMEGREVAEVHDPPDFAVLIYPVTTLTGPYSNPGVRSALTGDPRDTPEAARLSLGPHVTRSASPAFLVHGADDVVVPVENTLMLAEAYRAAGRPVDVHIYATGPHGFGLGARGRPTGSWPRECLTWMRALPDEP